MMVTKGWPPLLISVATQMNEGMNRRMNERMGEQKVTICFQKYLKTYIVVITSMMVRLTPIAASK